MDKKNSSLHPTSLSKAYRPPIKLANSVNAMRANKVIERENDQMHLRIKNMNSLYDHSKMKRSEKVNKGYMLRIGKKGQRAKTGNELLKMTLETLHPEDTGILYRSQAKSNDSNSKVNNVKGN